MRVVVAPDSFKGSMSASEVCDRVERGLRRGLPGVEVVKLPLADGGEGFVETLVAATGGTLVEDTVQDPLGRLRRASYGLLGEGETAVIEMAAASGLGLLREEERDPLCTTTYGTGQLILSALGRGVHRVLIGIGGSATVDGGLGMATALGVRFLDASGRPLGVSGGELARLERIDMRGRDPRLDGVAVEVACDVDNPLTGTLGAALLYGPQKGANPAAVEILEGNLRRLAAVVRRDLGREVEDVAGAGAAGGLGAGLMAFADGVLRPGVDLVLDHVGFDRAVAGADLVVTGEGRLDRQSLHGKLPVGVASRAARFGCPVIAIAGSLGEDLGGLHDENIAAYFSIQRAILAADRALASSGYMVEECAEQVARTLGLGGRLFAGTARLKSR